MESFCGDTEESTEDTEGRKKSKLKFLKNRLFGRSKKSAGERNAKLSQSASDITAEEGLGSDEDLVCSQGTMGSRAFSHDSIFLAEELTDAEPVKVLSQENVPSRIKTLQMKLQQQKLHLGPPPLVLPGKHQDEQTDGVHSVPEIPESDITRQSVLNKTTSPASSNPLSSAPKPAMKPVPLLHPSVNPSSSPASVESPVDFSSPAQFIPCLDTSAARHRMSVKPRNQRASTKKRPASTDPGAHTHPLNNIIHPESVKEAEEQIGAQDELTLETEQRQTDAVLSEVARVPPETAPKSSSVISQKENPPSGTVPCVFSPVLRLRPHRPTDVRERPHSAFVESELKDKRAAEFEMPLMPHDKRSAAITMGRNEDPSDRPSSTFGSVVALRSSFQQQVQGEMEGLRGFKRPGQGSGSFHLTTAKAKDGERPRSGSFVEPLEQEEAKKRATVGPDDKRDFQPRGGGVALGRLKQEGSPPKSSGLPWERRDSSKKIESVKPCADTGPEDVEINREVVEEAVEAKEEEGKACTFGIKLRPTSQSVRLRPDAPSNRHPKPPACEEQDDKQPQHETSSTKKAPTNTPGPGDARLTDAAPSATGEPHAAPTEVQARSSVPRRAEAPPEPQPAPQAASEVSWMSLAMEKTRSLQQLFTSKFPRDLAAVQTTLRPQAEAEAQTQTQTQTQAQTQAANKQPSPTSGQAANQPPADTVNLEPQAVKSTQMSAQQKVSAAATGPHASKPAAEAQAVVHPPVQTNPWTSQPALRSSTPTETSSPPAAPSPLPSGQRSPWSQRSLHRSNQLKPTPPSAAPSPLPGSVKEEKEVNVQEKEASSPAGRRAGWGGTVSERASLLEKQAPGTKGVELRKSQTEVQAPGDTPASTKSTAQSKDTKPEGQEWGKPAVSESSPIKVPDRTRGDKWPRKNVVSSSPSSSPTQPSALQSMSESSQPSWMELAKRKSMAWNDRTMD